MGPLTTDQLLTKVRQLASRFRGFGEREELRSEAMLAYYEGVASGDTDVSSLETKMRKAMNNYANFGTKPTKVPDRGENYRLTKELPPQEYDKLSPREKDVYNALRGNTKDISDFQDLLQHPQMSPEDICHWKLCIDDILSVYERQCLLSYVVAGMNQREIAEVLNVSPQAVAQTIERALDKLREVS